MTACPLVQVSVAVVEAMHRSRPAPHPSAAGHQPPEPTGEWAAGMSLALMMTAHGPSAANEYPTSSGETIPARLVAERAVPRPRHRGHRVRQQAGALSRRAAGGPAGCVGHLPYGREGKRWRDQGGELVNHALELDLEWTGAEVPEQARYQWPGPCDGWGWGGAREAAGARR
jgi:hypothetical protein